MAPSRPSQLFKKKFLQQGGQKFINVKWACNWNQIKNLQLQKNSRRKDMQDATVKTFRTLKKKILQQGGQKLANAK